jgi:hypothetical protein
MWAMQIIARRAHSPSSPRAAKRGATQEGVGALTDQRGRADAAHAFECKNAALRGTSLVACGADILMFKQMNSHEGGSTN